MTFQRLFDEPVQPEKVAPKDATLEQQIERERQEIENAPKIPLHKLTGSPGRCSWCGRVSEHLIYVDRVHDHDRYKGAECCG